MQFLIVFSSSFVCTRLPLYWLCLGSFPRTFFPRTSIHLLHLMVLWLRMHLYMPTGWFSSVLSWVLTTCDYDYQSVIFLSHTLYLLTYLAVSRSYYITIRANVVLDYLPQPSTATTAAFCLLILYFVQLQITAVIAFLLFFCCLQLTKQPKIT